MIVEESKKIIFETSEDMKQLRAVRILLGAMNRQDKKDILDTSQFDTSEVMEDTEKIFSKLADIFEK